MSDRVRKGRNQKPVTIDDIIAQADENRHRYSRYAASENNLARLKLESNELDHIAARSKIFADANFYQLRKNYLRGPEIKYNQNMEQHLDALKKLRDTFQAITERKKENAYLQVAYFESFNNIHTLLNRYFMQIN